MEHALELLDSTDYRPLGLAKDGHVIMGPYNQEGQVWDSCDVDICNGMKVDDDEYMYVASTFHPYFVGCWGPGSNTTLSQQCSSNPRMCSGAMERIGLALGLIFFSIIAML